MSRHAKILLQGCIFIALLGPPIAYKIIKWVEAIQTDHYQEKEDELLNIK